MKTLYDLLGALPNDDAEHLRAAFRRAAKAHHPDVNPGDPDALLRFRQIVRANDILGDAQQRATYDHLLQIALRRKKPRSRRDRFLERMRRLASDALAAGLVSAVSIGGYLAIQSPLVPPRMTAKAIETSGNPRAQTVAVATQRAPDVADQTTSREQSKQVAANSDPSRAPPAAQAEAVLPTAKVSGPQETSATMAADVPSAAGGEVKDARYYRERGIEAYNSGDLQIALVDFDLAISIDPSSLENYIDRSIVFYRLGDRKSAFADIAEAKRIETARGGQGGSR